LLKKYSFCINLCKYIKKKKIIKNNKQKFYKKYYIYKIKNNNLLKEFLFNNSNFNIKKNINKEFAILFKKNINKNFNNK